jgi:hypothetical protein
MLLDADLSLFLSSIKRLGKGLFTRVFNYPRDIDEAVLQKVCAGLRDRI